MGKYFSDYGELLVSVDEVFDDHNELHPEAYFEARNGLNKFPGESDAVKLFYADEFSDCTKGNYSTRTLYERC